MSLPVILRPAARAEFDEAADWLEARSPGEGIAFTRAVARVLQIIGEKPKRWPEVHGAVREAPVSGYRYAIYYREDPGRVTILAVFHTSRDPGVWQSRR